jgi:signal transduction histidine kinase
MLLILLLPLPFLLVLLGFYVFVGAPRSRTHQTFAAFVASLALWTIKDIVVWGLGPSEADAAWWAGASFIIALMLQYSLSVFALVFPEDDPVLFSRIAALLSPGVVFVPAILAGLMWESVSFADQSFRISPTVLAYAFGTYLYALFFHAFSILLSKYRFHRGTIRGQQLGAILWALVITVVLMTMANVILPLGGIYALLPVSSLFVLPGVLIYAYAISSFKLFSLQSALDQFRLFPIAYKVALSIAVVAVISFATFQIPIVWWSFGAGPTPLAWKRYLVFSVITALVPNLVLVALVIRTISRPVRQLTEAAVEVARGAYGTEVNLTSNDEVGLLAASFNEMSRKMARDIERLKELNDHLIRAEKLAAAGTLAAGVAHEVNNPLASISSLIQILQARSDVDDEAREMLRLVSIQISRISQVLKDMMDFARSRPAARKPLDLNELVESTIRLASFDRTFGKLRISTEFERDLPLAEADADQMQQVFLNILLNARDAVAEGGKIVVGTRYQPVRGKIVVSFVDNGPGITSEDLTHLFDPFFTTKQSKNGTGLGLAVCYGIVTAHGGRIQVTPGETCGTIIEIELPVEPHLSTVASQN